MASTAAPAPAMFDHVVVGAGASGAALAARLSEDPAISVLLLEAGVGAGLLPPTATGGGQKAGPEWS